MKTSLLIAVLFTLTAHITHGQMKQDSLTRITNISLEYPNWSPDGAKIAFMSDMLGGNYEIYTMRSHGTAIKRLTKHKKTDETPIWTHDSAVSFLQHIQKAANTICTS